MRNGAGSVGPEVQHLLAGRAQRDGQAGQEPLDPGAGRDDQALGDDPRLSR